MKFRSSSRAVFAAVCVALAAPALAGKSDGGLGGEYHFTNNGDKKLISKGDSFSSSYEKSLPDEISPGGGTSEGHAYAPAGQNFSGTTTWADDTNYGCYFSSHVFWWNAKGKYVFDFVAKQQDGSESAEKVYDCAITADVNEQTGRFTAYPVINKAASE
ncbi:hypothetical protein [Sphingomonas sp. BK345]|uniref:hypothetical protein n=2 Tax=unclassified Sphingomonas TaxID=196159 RepID=UPI0016198C31|nr:hypothetical protein [Sphingomonas sp. BK345]MBB3474775.1 hypothetical protein [Sphingomonas sp. BK345]